MKNGVLSYECTDSSDIYRCQFSILLKDCTNCFYCYDLRNCQNCFLSYNLRNQNYMILNEKYSKEEYDKKIKEFNLSSYKARKNLFEKFMILMREKALHRFVVMENTVSSSDNILFSHLSYDNNDIQYCDSCHNSNNLFGCCGIKKGSYMIFNKKYPKEEYLKLKEKIIEHMKKTGEYGEFFPPSISPVCYNETQGNYYMPETKEEFLSRGWLWENKTLGTFGKETIQPENIPDSIKDIDDSITTEVLK